MQAYLTITKGVRTGSHYVLDGSCENRIGRGLDCQIALSDPLSSRVHAVVYCDEDGWWVRDEGSRNGTYLNDQKIDEVRLVDGGEITICQAALSFHQGAPPTTVDDTLGPNFTQTIIFDAPVSSSDTGSFLAAALQDEEHARELLDLYQLSITLLGSS